MGSFSIWHWLIVIVIALLVFGGGSKISNIMGDFGKGIKAFKRGLKDEEVDDQSSSPQKSIDAETKNKDRASV
jgi:sec-independent protein translocase protein TatA